jgi:hypothetical protein
MQRKGTLDGHSFVMRILFTILAVELFLFSCSKSSQSSSNGTYLTLSHQQTQCADPWPHASNDSLTLIDVAHYLDSLSLPRTSLYIKQDGSDENCNACLCKTGNTIYVVAPDDDSLIVRYNRAGFK